MAGCSVTFGTISMAQVNSLTCIGYPKMPCTTTLQAGHRAHMNDSDRALQLLQWHTVQERSLPDQYPVDTVYCIVIAIGTVQFQK